MLSKHTEKIHMGKMSNNLMQNQCFIFLWTSTFFFKLMAYKLCTSQELSIQWFQLTTVQLTADLANNQEFDLGEKDNTA